VRTSQELTNFFRGRWPVAHVGGVGKVSCGRPMEPTCSESKEAIHKSITNRCWHNTHISDETQHTLDAGMNKAGHLGAGTHLPQQLPNKITDSESRRKQQRTRANHRAVIPERKQRHDTGMLRERLPIHGRPSSPILLTPS
jgi:hypothetical protein